MKLNKSFFILTAVVLLFATAGAVVFLKRYDAKEDITQSNQRTTPLPDIPAESTVSVPEPDFTDIETVATYNIPTKAAAGSESHAIYIEYSSSHAKGYLTYEADADNPASFTATKNSEGKWELTDYMIYSETDL